MIYSYVYNSVLGDITLASDGNALTGLWFDGQKYFGATLPQEHKPARLPVFEDTARWLDVYFSGENPGFYTSDQLCGFAVPARGLADFIVNTLRENDDLRRNCRANGGYVGTGSRRRGRA